MAQNNHIYFEPWLGTEYLNEGLWGRKVLIVGEAHYDEWPLGTKHILDGNFTQECVQEIVDGLGGATFWTRVRNRLGGAEHESQGLSVFWNRVAFYNFIQSAVSGGPRVSPTQKQWGEAPVAFREILTRLTPDRVLFVGKRLWNHAPPRDGILPDIQVQGQRLQLEWFLLGHRHVYATAIPHTASSLCLRSFAQPLCEFVVRDWRPAMPAL